MKVGILKQNYSGSGMGGQLGGDRTGAFKLPNQEEMKQIADTQEQQRQQEQQKPLYGNKENMGIAHYLANDIVQLVDVLHSMYGDDNPHWERIKYDVQRLKSLLEEALQG